MLKNTFLDSNPYPLMPSNNFQDSFSFAGLGLLFFRLGLGMVTLIKVMLNVTTRRNETERPATETSGRETIFALMKLASLAHTGIEPATLALLAPRSNQLS